MRAKAAPPLDTPTDLSTKAVTQMTQALNALLADTYALYFKTKNFHWHVSGPHFRSYHLLFDGTGQRAVRDDRRTRGTRAQAWRYNAAVDGPFPKIAANQGQ